MENDTRLQRKIHAVYSHATLYCQISKQNKVFGEFEFGWGFFVGLVGFFVLLVLGGCCCFGVLFVWGFSLGSFGLFCFLLHNQCLPSNSM